MKLGITLWGFSLGYREAVDLASRVEETGFHILFMVESPLGNDGVTAVAMMAARTSRLLLGTNIANVFVRHPGCSATPPSPSTRSLPSDSSLASARTIAP